jgi:hypothetical protein
MTGQDSKVMGQRQESNGWSLSYVLAFAKGIYLAERCEGFMGGSVDVSVFSRRFVHSVIRKILVRGGLA